MKRHFCGSQAHIRPSCVHVSCLYSQQHILFSNMENSIWQLQWSRSSSCRNSGSDSRYLGLWVRSPSRPLDHRTLPLPFCTSSRDSLGASAAESKGLYQDLVNRHPSTALALNHETLGIYANLIAFDLSDLTWLLLLPNLQRPLCTLLLVTFFSRYGRFNIFSLVMMSSHSPFNNSKLLDTASSPWLNVSEPPHHTSPLQLHNKGRSCWLLLPLFFAHCDWFTDFSRPTGTAKNPFSNQLNFLMTPCNCETLSHLHSLLVTLFLVTLFLSVCLSLLDILPGLL